MGSITELESWRERFNSLFSQSSFESVPQKVDTIIVIYHKLTREPAIHCLYDLYLKDHSTAYPHGLLPTYLPKDREDPPLLGIKPRQEIFGRLQRKRDVRLRTTYIIKISTNVSGSLNVSS